jgi:hypothetical protein
MIYFKCRKCKKYFRCDHNNNCNIHNNECVCDNCVGFEMCNAKEITDTSLIVSIEL